MTIKKDLIVIAGEFVRYCLVGGIAFAVDFSALTATQELLLKQIPCGVYIATATGFLAGLIVNYALSLKFVFIQAKDAYSGRSAGAFIVFAVIGAVGLALTECGMWVGVSLLKFHYLFVKVVVTDIVLLWNYGGRKILIFNTKEGS